MWYLKSNHDNSLFHLLTGKTHTINRKDGDLVLVNDQSISRNHSALQVSKEGEVFLWDEGSKYGTFVYEGTEVRKLQKEERAKIKVGDQIRFGLQWNIFILCKTDIVVCTSSINFEEKRILKAILPKIGGKFSNDWNDECTHLTMNQVSLTHKVVFALAAGKPIVTLEYWQKMEEAVTHHLGLPNIQDYQPSIGEEELQKQTKPGTLLPSKTRKTILKGKTFVFSSEDTKNKFRSLVECAGGVCKSVQTSKLLPDECCKSNYVVVRDSDECIQKMRNIISALKQKGLRAVPVSEIGLAIFNDSLVRFCNPFWCKPVILGGSPSQSQGVCLVENTEDIPLNTQALEVQPHGNIVIPPSLTSVASDTSVDSSRVGKRPPSPSFVDDRPSKRQNQKKENQKGGGSLQNWLQRSESDKKTSSGKESEGTCSFDASRDDMFGISPKTRNDKSKSVPGNSRIDDNDEFKVPSLKKRGRTEDEDTFKVPSPKRAATKKTKPPNRMGRVNPFESEDKIEDHSDDEIEVSKFSHEVTRKISSPTIEDDSGDEFSLPTSRKKSSRRIDDDETSNKTIKTSTGGKSTSKISKTVQDRPSTSRDVEETRKNGSLENRAARTAEARNVSTESETRRIITHMPNISEFLDKSTAILIKKEENEDEISEQELSDILNKVKIIELSMFRQRPPLRVQISSIPEVGGRPNFKKFRKSTQRAERRRIDLIVAHNTSMYVGVPEPDPDAPDNVSARNDSENDRIEDLFPSTNDRNQRNRQNRPIRQRNRIVDEWTVS